MWGSQTNFTVCMLHKVSHSRVSGRALLVLTVETWNFAFYNFSILLFVCVTVSSVTSFITIIGQWQTVLQVIELGVCLGWMAKLSAGIFIHQLLFLLLGRSRASFQLCPKKTIFHFFTSSHWSLFIDFIWVMKWWLGQLKRWPRIATPLWFVSSEYVGCRGWNVNEWRVAILSKLVKAQAVNKLVQIWHMFTCIGGISIYQK